MMLTDGLWVSYPELRPVRDPPAASVSARAERSSLEPGLAFPASVRSSVAAALPGAGLRSTSEFPQRPEIPAREELPQSGPEHPDVPLRGPSRVRIR